VELELELEIDSFMPALFVFCNRQRDKVKVLLSYGRTSAGCKAAAPESERRRQ